MEKDEIIIRNAALHILDSSVGIPVLSDSLLELTPDLNDFLRGHIYKLVSGDDLKTCVFDEESSEVYELLAQFEEERFIEISKALGKKLYDIMNANPAILPVFCDLSGRSKTLSCHSENELQRGLCPLYRNDRRKRQCQ